MDYAKRFKEMGDYLLLSLEIRVNRPGGVLPYPGTVEAPQRCGKVGFPGVCKVVITLSCTVVWNVIAGQPSEYATDHESGSRNPDRDPPVCRFYARYLNVTVPCPLV